MAELETAVQLYADVQQSLDVNKSLPWQLCIDALKTAWHLIDLPETQQFLDEYLYKVIHIVTIQSPSKLGTFEKNVMEESIFITMSILVKLLSHKPAHIATLVRLFDASIPFYHGSKIGYTFTPGFPAVRLHAAKRFTEQGGFASLLLAMQHASFAWPGGEALLIVLKTLNIGEVLAQLDNNVKAELISVMMKLLLNLPDEQLRRENTDVLNSMLHATSGICKHLAAIGMHEYVEKFRVFWFENTFKFMNSGSLVMKLFAWEQLNDLILEAKHTRPLASSYIVEGSGTAFVNGVYTMVPKPINNNNLNNADDDALKYTKASTAPHMPLLTLFRCTMRTKAKWWFISQADLEKPGTDKDIDFYLHKSTAEDEREPPTRGWTRVNPGINLVGIDPPPVFKRGELILAPGTTRESYFDFKLLDLCGKNNLLHNIFGPSIHREIVSRSGRLLLFLVEYDHLKKEDLQLIWKAAMQNNEVDIVDEIFTLLVPLVPYLGNDLVAGLMGLALDALRQGEHYAKVAQFVEKFAMDNFKYVGNLLTQFASVQLLSLVWEVYRDAQFDTLKSTHVLQDLLSFCLSQRGGVDMVIQRISDCRDALAGFAEQDSSSKYSGKVVDEAAVGRVIRALGFLVSKHTSAHMVIQLEQEGLVTCLVVEIERYVRSARARLEAGTLDLVTYSMQISDRLDILQRFYSINIGLSMSFGDLQILSNLLSQSALEVEAFFAFLKSCTKTVLSMDVALQVFQELICHPEIDWSKCGDEAFECFSAYYCELEGNSVQFPAGTPLPPKLGLDTLWRLALNIQTPLASSNSVNLLLQAYDSILYHDYDAYADLLKIVFSHLEAALVSAIDSGRMALSVEDQQRVSRCVHILAAALVKSKGEAEPAHAVRGNMFRIGVTVFYRRVTSYFNQVTQMDVVRSEKGSEGMVRFEVHPLHTVKELKDKIIELAELGSVNINLENVNREIVSNSTRLSELGLVDGCEISASYQSSFSTKSYEDDLYTENTSTIGNSRVTHIGQILANNYSMFDSLLTLCDLSKDVALTRSIWQLIMLIPTQIDLMQQSVEQVCFPDASPSQVAADWNQVLQESSETRTAYLLQIIDNLLQPAPELVGPAALERSYQFRDAFVATNGFSTVLRILISTPSDESIINSTTLAVALHIVHFLLFGDEAQQSMNTTINDIDASGVLDRSTDLTEHMAHNLSISAGLLEQVEACSAQVIEKLLFVARNAAAQQSSQVVQNALMVITKLIKSSDAASQLTSNPQSEVLLTTVLRSASKKVREMAADFAVQVGRTQPVVFQWLLSQLKEMTPSDQNCAELFSALTTLLTNLQSAAVQRGEETTEGAGQLARILADKLINYPRKKQPAAEERYVLLGYLETLDILIGLDSKAVASSPLGGNLVESFFSEFLFAMPSEDKDASPICDTPLTRQAAFNALSSYLATTMEGFEFVLNELSTLSRLAARHMHGNWGLQVSHDVKKPDMEFSGLKNQGCTCYMNSLLQVLYMSSAFREAVLATPLLETHRTSLWHKSDIELVGDFYLFEYVNGSWREGQIVGFDAVTSKHRVQYTKSDGTNDEIASFNIHEGRHQRETGRVRVIPSDNEEPINEREDAAYRVLDQLQRAFCFMKYSKRRFFDPIAFVEACKSLNLNFNVYHQNDAAEFCDQLLDRIETATKGKHTKKDLWSDVFMKNVFGGKWLYQKIPQDCEIYTTDKTGCGHWQSSRQESFLKVELMIRGKEKVEDSLAELMEGELMDGDNKIHCDVCTQKKATVRRTCFGDLPSTLILHLKRFDLDFQTFETVKLNNRMAFPTRINMLKYTKEGIEAEERRKAAAAAAGAENDGEEDSSKANPSARGNAGAGVNVAYEMDGEDVLDPSDYEYELQGVLVHAGVAQGGHYYSFVRDDATEDEWYKFDDDEVTPFHAEQIPVQCFGGPPSANNSNNLGSHSMDEDRTSNALMVLYNKVKKNPIVTSQNVSAASSPTKVTSSDGKGAELEGPVLVDGYQAYMREVRESNLQHILTCYLLDPDLHAFVRGLLGSISNVVVPASSPDSSDSVAESLAKLNLNVMQWSPKESPDDLPLRTVQYCCNFLLDVVLHCRERAAMRSTVHVLKQAFEAYPHTAVWFVSHILDSSVCSWFSEFTLYCTDALARATFVQIVAHAVTVIAPKEPTALAPFRPMKVTDIRAASVNKDPATLTALLVRLLLDHTFKSVAHVRTADELFVLIRDLSVVPCICQAFLEMGMVAFLSYFIMPDQVMHMVRTLFEKHIPQARHNAPRIEYTNLLQSVFEAMAALLGVPQIRKVNLLQERTYWESDLVPDAREALTTIFNESSHHGGMDVADIGRYFERVSGLSGQKVSPLQVRSVLDRFSTNPDGRLNLEGFLTYHTDQASYSPKNVWRDLHAFGYRNDLTRATGTSSGAPAAPPSVEEPVVPIALPVVNGVARAEPLPITENCRNCLAMITLYEVGMTASEAATRAIAKRVCQGDSPLSAELIHQALNKLLTIACDNTWNHNPINVINDFLRLLLSVEDGLQRERLYEILMQPKAGLAIVICHEKIRPSNCHANEFNKFFLFERYVSFVQELLTVPGVAACLTSIAEVEQKVLFTRGFLRLIPGYGLTDNEDRMVRNTVVLVEHAGIPEVNGEYHFTDVRYNAGFYTRRGRYMHKDVQFTLYKCSLKNGGFQWFLSITPDGMEPGTSSDLDFYYAQAKPQDKLPATHWLRMNPDPQRISRDPAPSVTCLRPDLYEDGRGAVPHAHGHGHNLPVPPARGDDELQYDSSDSDKDGNYMMVGDDTVDDSFVSSSTDPREYYD